MEFQHNYGKKAIEKQFQESWAMSDFERFNISGGFYFFQEGRACPE
jgi:hypothetical protein